MEGLVKELKNYKGIIIEESLEDRKILEKLKILNKNIEKVTKEFKTPWIKKWALDNVEIFESDAEKNSKRH